MIKRFIPLLVVFFTITTMLIPVSAQGVDCDVTTLSETISDYADTIATANYDQISAIAENMNTDITRYLDNCDTEKATVKNEPHEELFNVKATGNANIRSCNTTSCEVVAVSTAGQTYPVVSVADDWYEIDLGNGETGFIASWLTVRGPDLLIDLYEGYTDLDIACGIQGVVSRARRTDIDFAITGTAQDQVTVDILRPNASNPEPVWRQMPKTFIDTGDLYIHQVYQSSYWPGGFYQIAIERDGDQKIYEFELNQTGETTIFVICE